MYKVLREIMMADVLYKRRKKTFKRENRTQELGRNY